MLSTLLSQLFRPTPISHLGLKFSLTEMGHSLNIAICHQAALLYRKMQDFYAKISCEVKVSYQDISSSEALLWL